MSWFLLPLELHQKIYGYLRPVELIRLGRACKYTHETTRPFAKLGGIDPAELLEFWFEEGDELRLFRELQAKTGFLVGGSAALWLLGKFDWWPRDLDCYIHGTMSAMLVALLGRFGYVEDLNALNGDSHKGVTMRGFPHYPCASARETRTFLRTSHGRDTTVQIISTRWAPLHAILCSHSTVALNFFSHSWAVSLYPQHTFISESFIPLGGMCKVEEADLTRTAMDKYVGRGFTEVTSQMSAVDALSLQSETSMFRRSPGDSLCWSLDLIWPKAWGQLIDGDSPGRKEVLQACSWALVCEGGDCYLDTMPFCTSDNVRFTMDAARWQEGVLLRGSTDVIAKDDSGWPETALFDGFFKNCLGSMPSPAAGLKMPTGEAACKLWDGLRSVTSDEGPRMDIIMPVGYAEWWVSDDDATSCRLAMKCYCDRPLGKVHGTQKGLASLGIDLEFLDISMYPLFA
ncbi:hypothetical protein VNI00_004717 [Paramarasmius palmivorus]|uniref:F-box domain-containing protein n=1 Tax=Paramarasmius palmivorus TaxID=297713 RepID=A0AAW0DJ26_9AGAR